MQKSKKLFSVLLAMLMVFSISGASGLNAAAANSVSKTYSVKALVNSYTAKLKHWKASRPWFKLANLPLLCVKKPRNATAFLRFLP